MKNQITKTTWADSAFYVVAYRDEKFVAVVSGLGCNRGTLDASHSESAANKHAARLNARSPCNRRASWKGCTFKVEGMVQCHEIAITPQIPPPQKPTAASAQIPLT